MTNIDQCYNVGSHNETPVTVWGTAAEANDLALLLSTDDKAVTARPTGSADSELADCNAWEWIERITNLSAAKSEVEA